MFVLPKAEWLTCSIGEVDSCLPQWEGKGPENSQFNYILTVIICCQELFIFTTGVLVSIMPPIDLVFYWGAESWAEVAGK